MDDVPLRLNQLLAEAGHPPLSPATADQFSAYLTLLERWNAKTNLTAIRDREGILSRHFVESILCARALPTPIHTLLDFGSGAGLPGIPIAIMRGEVSVTLAESQNKKAAFLREVVRVLGLRTTVHAGRAEGLTTRFDCITLRAVDNMSNALEVSSQLLAPAGWLAILTTLEDAPARQTVANASALFHWLPLRTLPANSDRALLLAQRNN